VLTLTLVSPPHIAAITPDLVTSLAALTGSQATHWLAEGTTLDIRGIALSSEVTMRLRALLAPYPIDWCLQPEIGRRKKLLISDMDSTIIGQECIDELAIRAGIGAEVSAITERAMAGELDFASSLTQRVALLQGLPVGTLQQVWEDSITLNTGAETLVKTMRAHGAHTMLVSGGFTFFSSRVADAAGFAVHHANSLEVADGHLTGRVIPPILDKASKRHLLEAVLKELGLSAQESLAVGDGANDAEMIIAAGLGVAYRAKPALQALADASITHTDLITLLYFQGYETKEIMH
jgi:phosphoserine phosphatase